MRALVLICGLFLLGPVYAVDTDGDGVEDDVDNCSAVFNASQCDSDNDGFGNHCDGDLNNNGVVNSQDLILFRLQLGHSIPAPDFNSADVNCNGFVNSQDWILIRKLLGAPPGPSGETPEG